MYEIKENAEKIQANSDAIQANLDAINENKDNISKNAEAIQKEESERKKADDALEEKFKAESQRAMDAENQLNNRISKLDDRIDKVGAMAAAMASLHTMGYDPAAPTEIAAGIGHYRGKTGIAIGAFHYPNKDFMLNFSVSNCGNEYAVGVGATWRFGRVSSEKLVTKQAAKAESLKAVAKTKNINTKND